MQHTVLIIDDDEKLRSFVTSALEAGGFKTYSAQTAEEGISLALLNPPDLVLCDVVLPDALGFEAARTLNDNPATSNIPVVLMTGYPYMRSNGVSAQWRLLSKPFSMNSMLHTVAGVLRSALKQSARN
jgi:two-component system, sensor histidine kinase and response regulator